MTDPTETEGQVAEDSTGTTEASPETEGQSVAGEQTTQGPDESAPESFFDPSELPDELMTGYKQMQGAFTKKMQGLSENQHKVDAYNQFELNPQGMIEQLAQQYGLTVSQVAQAVTGEPQTWDEVNDRAAQKVMEQITPVLSEVQQIKQSNIEATLDRECPDWRVYQTDMISNAQKHPTLSPVEIYDLSLPSSVKESRAMQKALKKVKGNTNSAQVSGGSTTTKTSSQLPSGPVSFNDAVKAAKAQLAEQGTTGPWS